jgi:predicted HAD superfamily phosphohydrolase
VRVDSKNTKTHTSARSLVDLSIDEKEFPMSNNEREILKEKIKRAIKISSQKLIEKKKALGQKLVISEEGKIRVIEP